MLDGIYYTPCSPEIQHICREFQHIPCILSRYGTTTLAGDYIVDTSSLIHDFFSKECDECVHLVVDTTLNTDKVANTNQPTMYISSRNFPIYK